MAGAAVHAGPYVRVVAVYDVDAARQRIPQHGDQRGSIAVRAGRAVENERVHGQLPRFMGLEWGPELSKWPKDRVKKPTVCMDL